MAAGANFPTMTYQVDVVTDPNDPAQPAPTWTDITSRVLTSLNGGGGWRMTRGRTFPQAHVDPAILDLWVRNDDGAFTPGNTGSPYNPLRVMRQLQILAAYGSNALDANSSVFTIDTSSYVPGANTTVDHDMTRGFGAPGCLGLTAVAGGAVSATLATAVPIAAGQALSGWIASLAVTTPRAVTLTANWLTAAGAANGTSTVNVGNDATVWTQSGSVNFGVAPASTAKYTLTVTVAGCAAGEKHCFDLLGAFVAASVPAWTPPAALSPYPVGTGYVQRWTQRRDTDGVFPYVAPVITDALSALAGVEMLSCYDSEVLLDTPIAYYPCGETSGSAAGNISAYAQPPATPTVSKYGGGFTFGYSSVSPMPWESPPPTALSFGKTGTSGSGGWLALPFTPPAPAVSWELLFKVDALPSGGGVSVPVLVLADSKGNIVAQLSFIQSAGQGWQFQAFGDPGVNSIFATISQSVAPTSIVGDGKWHHLTVGLAADGKTPFLYVDGAGPSNEVVTPAASPISLAQASTHVVGGSLVGAFQGGSGAVQVAKVAVYNQALTLTRAASHYQAFATGFAGETTGARIARLLNYLPWYGGRSIGGGATSEDAARGLAGKAAVAAMQDAGDTDELGVVFANGLGAAAFRDRRYSQLYVLPRFVFGENETAGEIPYYGDIELDFDIEQVTNTSAVSRTGGVSVAAANTSSVRRHFPRGADPVTLNIASDLEVEDRANWTVSDNTYGQPRLRVTQLTFKPTHLNPRRVPLAWPAALSLEIGDPIRVMSRPPGGAVTQVDCVVDQITHTVGETPGEWSVQLVCSPLIRPWMLSAARSTLNAASVAGAPSITLKAFPDAASNPVESLLHVGQILTIVDPGVIEDVGVISVTSSAPGAAGYATVAVGVRQVLATGKLAADVSISAAVTTMTLTANCPAGTVSAVIDGEVFAVSAGAGTATLTFSSRGPGNGTNAAPHTAGATVTFLAATTGAVNAHAAGAVVAEVMAPTPAGAAIRNPARWDAFAVIGALTATVKTTVAAGVSTITLTGLGDFPANFPAADLWGRGGVITAVPGDLLRLSPGTVNDETLTIDHVGTTSSDGSFTVTFTTVTAHGHTAGDVVCEPLPSGVNNPANVTATAIVGY